MKYKFLRMMPQIKLWNGLLQIYSLKVFFSKERKKQYKCLQVSKKSTTGQLVNSRHFIWLYSTNNKKENLFVADWLNS